MNGSQTGFIIVIFFIAVTSGQICVKQFVGGKFKSYGNCGGDTKSQSIVADLDRSAKVFLERPQYDSSKGQKEPEQPQPTEAVISSKIPVTLKHSCQGAAFDSAKSTYDTGGVFDMEIPGVGLKEVYCDITTDGGNWIVMQRVMDGSVKFGQNWDVYVKGFGNANGELWLGLEAIYQLTKGGNYELRIDMIEARTGRKYSGALWYAKYSSFMLGPASDNYRLYVSGYSGNATDSFGGWHSNKQQFSTRDRDNDADKTRDCANLLAKGGWWYGACGTSHLNDGYNRGWMAGGRWVHNTRNSWIDLSFIEMKIRKKQ